MARILLISLILLMQSGCMDQKIVEELGFIHTLGYESNEEGEDIGKLKVTASFPIAETLEQQTNTIVVDTPRASMLFLNKKTDKNLVLGQVRSILIEEKLAEKGVWDLIDTFYRDPVLRPTVKLSLVKGSPQQMLSKDYPNYKMVDSVIEKLLTKEAKLNAIPEMDIHKFAKDYLDDAIDPIAPIILPSKDGILVEGIGLFSDDQLKISLQETKARVFFLLTGEFKKGQLPIKINKEEDVLFNFLKNKISIKVELNNNEDIDVNLSIDLKGYLVEYQGEIDINDENKIAKVEGDIQEYLENEIHGILEIMKEHQIDNLGLGKYIKRKMDYQTWKNLDWPKSIDRVNINPTVTVTIIDTGLVK
ncbi:Ger(x)C family spore germination protein [Ureibacillus sp. MALMAid1270]|uniref:Ger(x)C family spore germination protein n=1 Tax=Ureibacillus sp. MALMAid1270 TaxID=3411629 RepID=UPI003BA742CC